MNNLTKYLIEDLVDKKQVLCFAGNFSPVTYGHFNVVERASKKYPNADKIIIFIGDGVRDNIDQNDTMLIWNIYKKYLPMKVEFIPTKSPIQAVYTYSKENPQEEIIWILGTRDNNEQDKIDIIRRTRSIDKYPNINVDVINTEGNISGTLAREAVKKDDQELFFTYLPKQLSDDEKMEVWDIVNSKINNILSELKDTEIKYWALFANIYNALSVNPHPRYLKLKEKLKGDPLKALEYFYNEYFKENIEEDLIPGGIAQNKDINDLIEKYTPTYKGDNITSYINKQLEDGIKIEKEHTTDENIAKEIAIDHLWEDINYYIKLDKMENPSKSKIDEYINKIMEYCCQDLQIPTPELEIVGDDYIRENASFGGYSPTDNKIYLALGGRKLVEVMRSLSHEICHHGQNQRKELTSEAGEDGDIFEDQANSYAGKVMRKFGRENPEIFFITC